MVLKNSKKKFNKILMFSFCKLTTFTIYIKKSKKYNLSTQQ